MKKKEMSTRELRKRSLDCIFRSILHIPSSRNGLYNKITKFITSIIKSGEDAEYILFALQSAEEEVGTGYYLHKFESMNEYQRFAYFQKIVETKLFDCHELYDKEKLRFVGSDVKDCSDYSIVAKNASDRFKAVDITEFIDN